MQRRRVGSSGLQVSRLGLGTMTWGHDTDPDAAADQLRVFVQSGGTLVETADGYGGGVAQDVLAGLLRRVVARDDLVLAGRSLDGDGTQGAGAGRGALLSGLDRLLRRLGTEYLDLWQLPGWDPDVPLDETLAAAEAELIPAATHHGAGLLAWAPLGRGLLTGRFLEDAPAEVPAYVEERRTEHSTRIVQAVLTAAEGLGTSPLAVALAWVRDRPGVAAAVVGARDAAQLTASTAAEQVVLPEAIRAALDDVSAAR